MTRDNVESTIMFTDVAGSVAIFEKHGDRAAKSAIDECVKLMLEIVNHHNGVLVRTIGDEIMCRFAHPDDAVEAACEINTSIKIPFGEGRIYLKVRTGLHSGEIIIDETDIYGDAVNVAARMVQIARADQIITTQDTYSTLSAGLKEKAREFDRAAVKGKNELITIYDVIWECPDNLTCVILAEGIDQDSIVALRYRSSIRHLTPNQLPFTIGRSLSCDLVIDSGLASRLHLKIDYIRGKFFVVDDSTNGTYLKPENDKQVYFRRERVPLAHKGWISLGAEVSDDNQHMIAFTVS